MTDSTPDETPISPITRTGDLPQQAPPTVGTNTSLIDASVPAINAQPVELDGIPTSPQEQELKQRMTSVKDNKNADTELLKVGGIGTQQIETEKREAMLANRSKDPGVIFDVPNEPTAEEVEAANSKGRSGLEANTHE